MVWYGMVCNISNKIFFLVNDLKYVKMKKLKNEKKVRMNVQILKSDIINNSQSNLKAIKRSKNKMSVSVTSLLLKTLENATKEYARECVRRCSVEYGFDATEALLNLDLENLRVGVKEMKKRSSGKKEAKEVAEKKTKGPKEVAVKCGIKLPFIESELKESGCFGLSYNCGLFTQCPKARMMDGSYCKTCQKEADSSSAGKPNAGTVEDRLSVGLMEYRDLKGRKVVAYSKVFAKDGLDRVKVEEEALKVNVVIPPEHFASAVVEKAGRRKIVKKKKDVVPEASVEDLFATLLLGSDEDEEGDAATVIMSDSEDEDLESARQELEHEKEARNEMKGEDKLSKLAAVQLSKEEKAAKLAAEKESKAAKLAAEKESKAAKLAAEKESKAAKLLEEKAAKEEKLAAEKESKAAKLLEEKAAKELKLAAEKAAKEEKLAAEKAAKEEKLAAEKAAKEEKLAAEKAAKELKLAAEKAAKEEKLAAEKAAKEAKAAAPVKVGKKATKAEEKAAPKAAVAAVAASEAPKKVTVKRITIEGKQYLKTAENLLYDPETKDEVGIYDEATNTIKALPEEDEDEIGEDGYESDN